MKSVNNHLMANHIEAYIVYYTRIPQSHMPHKCPKCDFFIFSLDSHSSQRCEKNSELIANHQITALEAENLIANLRTGDLKAQVKADTINFNSLAQSSYRCPIKACTTKFENMVEGKRRRATTRRPRGTKRKSPFVPLARLSAPIESCSSLAEMVPFVDYDKIRRTVVPLFTSRDDQACPQN